MTPGDKPCPNCGHCPTCGRHNLGPRWPWHQPYPYRVGDFWYSPNTSTTPYTTTWSSTVAQ